MPSTVEIAGAGVDLVSSKLKQRGLGSVRVMPSLSPRLRCQARSADLELLVKTNLKPKPGGGVGKAALDWWILDDHGADIVALADLSSERVWLFTADEVKRLAQQHSGGRHHLYMYVDPSVEVRNPTGRGRDSDFEAFLFERRVGDVFQA